MAYALNSVLAFFHLQLGSFTEADLEPVLIGCPIGAISSELLGPAPWPRDEAGRVVLGPVRAFLSLRVAAGILQRSWALRPSPNPRWCG
jgi:hypothetical protein